MQIELEENCKIISGNCYHSEKRILLLKYDK